MKAETLAALRRGIGAALIASTPQVLGTHLAERLLHLPRGSANLGPRLIRRLGRMTGHSFSEEGEWLGSASFHFGYSAAWGALYGLAHRRLPVHPVLGGLLLSGTIYTLTFPRWGFATMTRTEPHPRSRSWRRKLLLSGPPFIFGLGTALLYGHGPRPGEIALAAEIIGDPLRLRESSGAGKGKERDEESGAPSPSVNREEADEVFDESLNGQSGEERLWFDAGDRRGLDL